jgi:hypothetical protein
MPEQYKPFAIVWHYTEGDNQFAKSFGLSGETGAVPFFVDTAPREGREAAPRPRLDHFGLLKGLLYTWDKECEGPQAVSKEVRRRLLDDLVFIFNRPSLEQAIIEVAGAIRGKNGLGASYEVLKNGVEIMPESSGIRSEFILTSSFLLLTVKPGHDTEIMDRILEVYEGMDPEKLIPGARESLPLLKLAALNALGKTENMREFFRGTMLGKKFQNPEVADQAERLVITPNLAVREAFEPVIALIRLEESNP